MPAAIVTCSLADPSIQGQLFRTQRGERIGASAFAARGDGDDTKHRFYFVASSAFAFDTEVGLAQRWKL